MRKPFSTPGDMSIIYPAIVLPTTMRAAVSIETVARTPPAYSVTGNPVKLPPDKTGMQNLQAYHRAQSTGESQAQRPSLMSPPNMDRIVRNRRRDPGSRRYFGGNGGECR